MFHGVTKLQLEDAYKTYHSKYYGQKGDYFAALYLAQELNKPIDEIAHQITFGNNDYGIDAFHIDSERRNLYLYQFKWSNDHKLFKESYHRLIKDGMERIFGNPKQDQNLNPLLSHLKASIHENQSVIDRVYIKFVFNGSPEKAEKNKHLESLREDLESKKYLINNYFVGRDVSLTIGYVSNETNNVSIEHVKDAHRYKLSLENFISSKTENGETIFVGFVYLLELYKMYQVMGIRMFERNLRAGLSLDKPVNRALKRALKDVLDGSYNPEHFVFNHNGVTISVEKIDFADNHAIFTEPRVLNGAQTLTCTAALMEQLKGSKELIVNMERLESIKVLAKIVCSATQPFITNVTINTNRQNPVEPVNLRASDEIQLQFEDKFKDEVEAGYERQENAFESQSDEDLTEKGIKQRKKIKIRKLHFVALGDRHSLTSVGNTNRIWYSGTPESTDFRELQSGYENVVDFNENEVSTVGVKSRRMDVF